MRPAVPLAGNLPGIRIRGAILANSVVLPGHGLFARQVGRAIRGGLGGFNNAGACLLNHATRFRAPG